MFNSFLGSLGLTAGKERVTTPRFEIAHSRTPANKAAKRKRKQIGFIDGHTMDIELDAALNLNTTAKKQYKERSTGHTKQDIDNALSEYNACMSLVSQRDQNYKSLDKIGSDNHMTKTLDSACILFSS